MWLGIGIHAYLTSFIVFLYRRVFSDFTFVISHLTKQLICRRLKRFFYCDFT